MAKKDKKVEVQNNAQEVSPLELAERKRNYLKFVAEHTAECQIKHIRQMLDTIVRDLRRTADDIERDLQNYGEVKAAEYAAHRLLWMVPNFNLDTLLGAIADVRANRAALHAIGEMDEVVSLLTEKSEQQASETGA